jgi:cold shock CspA family protein
VLVGKVKKLIEQQSFGFVTLDDGREVFVHRDKLPTDVDELVRADAVRLDVQERPDGQIARHKDRAGTVKGPVYLGSVFADFRR